MVADLGREQKLSRKAVAHLGGKENALIRRQFGERYASLGSHGERVKRSGGRLFGDRVNVSRNSRIGDRVQLVVVADFGCRAKLSIEKGDYRLGVFKPYR